MALGDGARELVVGSARRCSSSTCSGVVPVARAPSIAARRARASTKPSSTMTSVRKRGPAAAAAGRRDAVRRTRRAAVARGGDVLSPRRRGPGRRSGGALGSVIGRPVRAPSRITSRGAGRPVQALEELARPGGRGSPGRRRRVTPRARAAESRPCRRPGRPGPPPSRSHRCASAVDGQFLEVLGTVAEPDAVQLTSRSAAVGASTACADLGAQRVGALGRAVPDRHAAAPASRSAQTTARALPPAPSTSAVRPRGRPGSAAMQAGRVGVVGVDRAVGAEGQRVGRADRARASVALVGERERGLLVRDRHVRAEEAGGAAARGPSPRRARAGPAAAGSASPSGPSAASAALCIAGERLWRDRPAEDAEALQSLAVRRDLAAVLLRACAL